MALLNKTTFRLLFRRGVAANLTAAAVDSVEGEPAFTTDTHQVYVSDGTRFLSAAELVAPALVCHEGNVVVNTGEVVVNG